MIWLAIVLAFAIYWHTLHGELVLDDLPGIQNVSRIWKGDWGACRWFHWRSIPQFTMAWQVHVAGPQKDGQPVPFQVLFALHSGNVLIHALAGLVFGQILALQEPGLATMGTLLWIAMPAAVNATAYLSSRATLLAGLFSLAALWCVLAGWPVLAVPCIVLALMSKEDHALLPLGLAGAALATGQTLWAIAFAAAPFLAAAFLWKRVKSLLRTAHSPHLVDAGIPEPFPKEHRRLTIFTELLLRFPQWVVGTGYCVAPAFKSPSRKRIAGAFAIAGGIAGLAVAVPEARFPLWLVLCSPLPLYALMIQVRDAVMDYRAYSAMVGPLMLAVPLMPSWLAVLLLVGWSLLSAYRAFDWTTPMALWKGAVRDGGGPVAWINLGSAHQMRREFDQARHCYAECLKDYPDTGVAILNLAMIEGMEGKPEAARDKAEECVRLNPRYKAGWQILGQVYDFLKDKPNAERCARRVEELTA